MGNILVTLGINGYPHDPLKLFSFYSIGASDDNMVMYSVSRWEEILDDLLPEGFCPADSALSAATLTTLEIVRVGFPTKGRQTTLLSAVLARASILIVILLGGGH